MKNRKNAILLMFLANLVVGTAQTTDVYLADPTILLDNGTYYMYGTEKKPQKGFPVYTSTDLLNWLPTLRINNGYALMKNDSVFGTQGFWAPQVMRYKNKYIMAYTANENLSIAESTSPTGPFVQKTAKPIDEKTKKIDPFLFFDNNGKIYLYHVRLNRGNSIWVGEMSNDLSSIKDNTLVQCIKVTEPWENTWPEKTPPITEGPTVIKHKNIYYMFYSANDFRNIDYSVGYATASNPLGPWTKFEGNPIISRKITGQNGSGHGDVFKDKKGGLYYIFHTHFNDSTVHNRRTLIVSLKFITNKKTGVDEVTVLKNSIIKPQISCK